MTTSRTTKTLGIRGTQLTLDGKPFFWQGLAFFNALHNPAFNRSAEDRLAWLHKFKTNGINVLRIWCQWNFPPPRTFTDVGPDQSMYTAAGEVKEDTFGRLVALISALDSLDMGLEVAMFSAEKQPYFLPIPAQERATRELTERLRPYGNLIQQIWSEDSTEVMRYFDILKKADADRIVTSAPGVSSVLGDDKQNRAYDVLTPHTLRRQAFPFWYLAPAQIQYLLDTYHKPVIDDSPARSGPIMYGGNEGGTKPEYHIEQIRRDRAAGAYHNYLHDMFQYGYGNALTPPSGIPDPDFSPFHRTIFDYLRDHATW